MGSKKKWPRWPGGQTPGAGDEGWQQNKGGDDLPISLVKVGPRLSQWIGLRESPIFHGKIYGRGVGIPPTRYTLWLFNIAMV